MVSRCLAALLAVGGAPAESGFQTAPVGELPAGGIVKSVAPFRVLPERPACILAGSFPVIGAAVDPWDSVESARLLFRPESHRLWYSVPMQRAGQRLVGVLPKPRPSAQRVVYYVEVTGHRQRARSVEQTVPVAGDEGDCPGAPAAVVDSAALTVTVPKGAPAMPPVPPGFIPTGAVGAEGGGGGAAAGLIMAGVGGSAAAAAVVMLRQGSHDREPFLQRFTPELVFLGSNPPPESTLSIAGGAPLEVRVRVRVHQAIQVGSVRVILWRAAEGPLRPCAVLAAPHNGFVLNAPTEIVVGGPLLLARPCEPADRIRIVVEDFGREFLVTGTPGLPDVVQRYFLVP
jgi:hypothetical protein